MRCQTLLLTALSLLASGAFAQDACPDAAGMFRVHAYDLAAYRARAS